MKTNSPVVNGSNSTSKLPRWVLEMDRITVPHTVSAVIVSVADSLSPLCDALLGSNERAEFKVIFEMIKTFYIMIEKVFILFGRSGLARPFLIFSLNCPRRLRTMG